MPHRFVNDGHGRARRAIEQEVRAELEARYAEALQRANVLQRLRIKRQINKEVAQEVARRVNEQAPREGLY